MSCSSNLISFSKFPIISLFFLRSISIFDFSVSIDSLKSSYCFKRLFNLVISSEYICSYDFKSFSFYLRVSFSFFNYLFSSSRFLKVYSFSLSTCCLSSFSLFNSIDKNDFSFSTVANCFFI